jgi:hypothetical protein
MKILFSTQSSSLQMFYNIARRMEARYSLEPSIFITSDRAWHDGFAATEPSLGKRALLGEWTIAEEARSAEIKQEVLAQYEDRYGETLWNAAICDRRFMSGWKSYFKNDYKPRCSEREILSRLQVACERVRRFFDEHAPTQLVGFTCVTYLEYLTVLEQSALGASQKLRGARRRPARSAQRAESRLSQRRIRSFSGGTGDRPLGGRNLSRSADGI